MRYVAGNKLLAAVVSRLEQVTGSLDSLCRSGGDEFIYLAEAVIEPDEAGEAAGDFLMPS
jgi:GGDEF domain-containing protein